MDTAAICLNDAIQKKVLKIIVTKNLEQKKSKQLILLHSEWPLLYEVMAILKAIGLNEIDLDSRDCVTKLIAEVHK